MSTRQNFTTTQLIKRSMSPSGVSFILCGLAGFFLVAVNAVLLSVDLGTSLPGILDGQWAIAYTQHVVQPLTTFLSNNAFNKILVAMLWGAAGFAVYIGFEYAIQWSKSLKQSRNEIQMARGRLVEQPLKGEAWKIVWWRVGIILAGILFIIAMQPLLRDALSVAPALLVTKHLTHDLLHAGLAVLEWTLFWHGCVVFLRLYSMRTRIFGDDKLY